MEPCRGGDEAWDLPRGKRSRRRRQRQQQAKGEQETEQRGRLQEARLELLSSEFWESSRRIILSALQKILAPGKEIAAATSALGNLQLTLAAGPAPQPRPQPADLLCVCYGLGSFSSCVKSRYQLAFLLLLLKELQIPEKRCYIFDPVFSRLEINILHSLDVSVLLENEEGKRPVSDPTIFYMIHCGKALYNNLLWSNWSMGALCRTVIVGNSFKGIKERMLTKTFQKEYRYIAKVFTAVEEDCLPSHPRYLDVFNDTSVHCFPAHKLRQLPQETWTCQEEPDYQWGEEQTEIIRNKP